jgi:hypothetical protein
MPSFGRYEQAAELVRRLRADSRPVAPSAATSVARSAMPGAARPAALG